jgi:glycosyltransferase involved in cell wall biosynthesis
MSEPLIRPLRLLWFIDLDHRTGIRHGGALRWFNLSRELTAGGHSVQFAVAHRQEDDAAARRSYLQSLERQRVMSGYIELEYDYPRGRGRLAHLLTHPGFANRVLRAFQDPVSRRVDGILAEERVDVCILSDRRLLFLAPGLHRARPLIIDWGDSFVLYHWREALLQFRRRRLRHLLASLRALAPAVAQEACYGGHAAAHTLVSPIDKRCLDRINRVPGRNHVILNGVRPATPGGPPPPPKQPGRLIFTGSMSFAPNYEGALWFIDYVLPLIRRARPEVVLVVAGQDPVPPLRARATSYVQVPGLVADMAAEIATSQLYVAPLISGSGFKNKVVEAISNGTFVVGTPTAVEFLPESVRSQLLVAESPSDMARAVLAFLDDPARFEIALPGLVKIMADEFSWARRAGELLALARELHRRPVEGATPPDPASGTGPARRS